MARLNRKTETAQGDWPCQRNSPCFCQALNSSHAMMMCSLKSGIVDRGNSV